jgi:ZIP family zinc transporter
MLVIGFGLHNATEGFGIVAPLAADVDDAGAARRPGWGFLLALGAIGGGPTFVGTLLGHGFTSEPVSVVFLTLAAGSLIYVIAQLIGVAGRAKRSDLLAYGMLLGLLAGFVTDAIVTAAGV